MTVRGIKLYRDIYYTHTGGNDQPTTYFVQPGHYIVRIFPSDTEAMSTIDVDVAP